MNELVSIICTIKNGEKFLSNTIDSICKQTYLNWEFIIINDGSEDLTQSILDAYALKDSRIKVIKTNGVGRGKALNLAIENSKGKYIANVDVDDPSHPRRIENQICFLRENTECSIVFCESLFLQGMEEPKWDNNEGLKNLISEEITMDTLYKRNPINHSSLFIEKKTLLEIGGYDATRKSLYDYELWFRLISQEKFFFVLKNKLVSKRVHEDQSFESKRRIQYLRDTRYLKKQYLKNNLSLKNSILLNTSFLYGLLPQGIRFIMKNLYMKIK